MEKKTIIRFLNEKKRGAYTLLVEMYADVVTEMPITLALTVIKEDLEKETGAPAELHYFSLGTPEPSSSLIFRTRQSVESNLL